MPRSLLRIAFAVLPLSALLVAGLLTPEQAESQSPGSQGQDARQAVSRPTYDDAGQLRLPPNYREWIFVGSSLGLSYTEGAAMGHEMFHETLMEPGAYRHFVDTGEFADGTQFVLILHGAAESVLPGRRGRFANEIHGVEMAIKDFSQFDEGWAYFGFGGMGGIRDTAEAFPQRSCHDCHAEHAALDNVFAQFYPMLTEAAGVEVALHHVGDESDTGPGEQSGPMSVTPTAEEEPADERHADVGAGLAPTQEGTRPSSTPAADENHAASTDPVVAYSGLDPVMLIEGREEMGKAEIVEDYDGLRYQFTSEPHRAAFAADPTRFALLATTGQ